MANRDITPLFTLGDIPAALGLLTRLPVKVDADQASARGAAAAWAYPLAGLVVGTLSAVVGCLAMIMALPVAAVALLMLATQVIVTGALHEDGLADSVDGFWGGWDAENRLHIMKDSAIGTYGVLALLLSIGLRWSALFSLLMIDGFVGIVIAAAMMSRACMVGVMHLLPNARKAGLSQSVGQPARATATLGGALALAGAFIFAGIAILPVILVTMVAVAICGLIAHWKIGGQTGDVLGATQQITEIAALLTAAALFAA